MNTLDAKVRGREVNISKSEEFRQQTNALNIAETNKGIKMYDTKYKKSIKLKKMLDNYVFFNRNPFY